MTPNEDLWPWVKHAIRLPCCRNACFFTHSFLSLSFFIIVCYSFGHFFTKSVVFSTFLSISSFSLFLSCQHQQSGHVGSVSKSHAFYINVQILMGMTTALSFSFSLFWLFFLNIHFIFLFTCKPCAVQEDLPCCHSLISTIHHLISLSLRSFGPNMSAWSSASPSNCLPGVVLLLSVSGLLSNSCSFFMRLLGSIQQNAGSAVTLQGRPFDRSSSQHHEPANTVGKG